MELVMLVMDAMMPDQEWSSLGTVTSGAIHAGRGINQLFNGLINS